MGKMPMINWEEPKEIWYYNVNQVHWLDDDLDGIYDSTESSFIKRYEEKTDSYFEVIITGSDLAEKNETFIEGFGPPPGDRNPLFTISKNSIDGISLEANVILQQNLTDYVEVLQNPIE